MSEYSEEFEQNSNRSNKQNRGTEMHKLKLSFDLLSVRNMQIAANVFITYQL